MTGTGRAEASLVLPGSSHHQRPALLRGVVVMTCLGRGALSENEVVAIYLVFCQLRTAFSVVLLGDSEPGKENSRALGAEAGSADTRSFSCALRGVAIAVGPYCFCFGFTGNPPLLRCYFFLHLSPFLLLCLNASSSFSLASFSGSQS